MSEEEKNKDNDVRDIHKDTANVSKDGNIMNIHKDTANIIRKKK